MDPTIDTGSGPNINNTIDALLERYLLLLDEYTSLRAELARLQANTFQHLARANFAAERGVRYGADFYDQRMQAARTVEISTPRDKGEEEQEKDGAWAHNLGVAFRIVTRGPPTPAAAEGEEDEEEEETAREPMRTRAKQQQQQQPPATTTAVKHDPLRWFGVLTPPALRQTQASAVDVVERVVPRLVTVDAAMRDLEIEVRRARKRRAKVEASAAGGAGKTRQEAGKTGRAREAVVS